MSVFLQFLNGGRDQEVEDLNPQASLVLGSAGDAHIRVGDPGIEGRHCQVYPAQGSFWLQDLGAGNTILHMKRLKGTTEGLKAGDIFIIGTTFVKFWTERPAVGGGGGGAAAPAADPGLERELAAARTKAEEAGRDLEQARQELERAQGEAEAARAKAEQAEGELERLRGERERLDEQRQEAERARDELQGRIAGAEAEAAAAKAEAEAAAARAKAEAEEEAARAKAAAEAELAAGREALEREQAEGKAALEATRAELEALRAEAAVRGRDRLAALRDGGDLAALVEGLALPGAVRARLEAALEDAVTREALARAAGPVVPLRGLRVPGCERDLEAELGAARRRAEHVAAARTLGLADLDASELDRLLEAARG
ncbi:MAG: FHA domain-containing protein [Planctomycetes bacterium]|nr:FHA domain-containing protein [Planctomycetota bacterium]